MYKSESNLTPLASPPWLTDSSESWVTVRELAKEYRRSVRTVQTWCNDGTLLQFGFSLYKDPKARWWIKRA